MPTDVDQVRARPGMFVGSTADELAVHEMLWDVIANAFDEHLAGRATRLAVTIHEDGTFTVEDDGAGIPVHDVDGQSFLELACTRWHDSPTLDGHAPHAHVGLRGLGLCPVNALSSRFVVETARDGEVFRLSCAHGVPIAPAPGASVLERRGPTARRGTTVTVTPDRDVMPVTRLDGDLVAGRLRELSALAPGLTTSFRDERTHVVTCPGGMQDLARAVARRNGCGEPGVVLSARADADGVTADIAVAFGLEAAYWARAGTLPSSTSGLPVVLGFVNWERSPTGDHVKGLMAGLDDAVRAHCKRERCAPRRVHAELIALVAVTLPEPTFDSRTRTNLVSPAAQRVVRKVTREMLAAALQRDPEIARVTTSPVARRRGERPGRGR